MRKFIALLVAFAFAVTSASPALAQANALAAKPGKLAATKKEPLDINRWRLLCQENREGPAYKRKDEVVQNEGGAAGHVRQDQESDRR
jgi:hypothetical protein